MGAKRWCIPIAGTGLAIKRSKELVVLRGVPPSGSPRRANGASFSAFRQHIRARLLPALAAARIARIGAGTGRSLCPPAAPSPRRLLLFLFRRFPCRDFLARWRFLAGLWRFLLRRFLLRGLFRRALRVHGFLG